MCREDSSKGEGGERSNNFSNRTRNMASLAKLPFAISSVSKMFHARFIILHHYPFLAPFLVESGSLQEKHGRPNHMFVPINKVEPK